jgi:glycosyltransferase involved in cell wall biosynthesis
MKNNPLISVVTPTIGNPLLQVALQSIQDQTYENIEHLIIVDGQQHKNAAQAIINKTSFKKRIYTLCLPYSTGVNRYLGHRIYGGCSYIEIIHNQNLDWAYSLRKIVDQEGHFLFNDDCQGLGKYTSFLKEFDLEHHIDTNCFLINKLIMVNLAPIWYRRNLRGQVNADMLLSNHLLKEYPSCNSTGFYSVNYRLGSSDVTARPGFFLNGNSIMKKQHPSIYPWRREDTNQSQNLPNSSNFIVIGYPGGSRDLTHLLNQLPEIFYAGEIFNCNIHHDDVNYPKTLLSVPQGIPPLFWFPEFLRLSAKDKKAEITGIYLCGSPFNSLSFSEASALIDSGFFIPRRWEEFKQHRY